MTGLDTIGGCFFDADACSQARPTWNKVACRSSDRRLHDSGRPSWDKPGHHGKRGVAGELKGVRAWRG